MVCWDTSAEGEKHRVYYDTKRRHAAARTYRFSQASQVDAAYLAPKGDGGTDAPALFYHHVPLTGLKPDTTYYFVMVSDNAKSKEFHFKTAPVGDTDFKIIYGGDSRTGHDARRRMNRLIATMSEEDESILAFAHGGDYVNSGARLKCWTLWMKDHELSIAPSGRMLPLIPARGNHESRGPLYDRVFGFPGGEGKNYFATQMSSEVLFLTLNSCIGAAGAQKTFLESSLSNAEEMRWRVAQYHKPAYPAVKKPGKELEHWVPLFETYNLALGCEADGHCIKRTVPIRNGTNDVTGVIYIGEGGLGVGPRNPRKDRWYLQPPGMATKGHHLQLLSFGKSTLTIDAIGIDRELIDSHTIDANRFAGK